MNKSKKGNALDWEIIKRLYKLATPYRGMLWLTTILTLLAAVVGPYIPKLIQAALDNEVAHKDLPALNQAVLYILLLYLLNTVITLVKTYASNVIAQNVIRDLRMQVFQYINRLKLKFIDKTPVGTMVTRNVSDIETLANFFTEGAITIAGDILQIVMIVSFMFIMDWQLTLVSLSVLPFLFIATYIFKEKVRQSFTDVRTQVAKLNAFVQEHITGMQVVQIFNREQVEYQKFKEINKRHEDANIKSVFYYSVYFPVVDILTAAAVGLIVWFGMNSIIAKGVDGSAAVASFGTVVSFILYINMFFRPVRQLADRFNSMQMGIVAAERVFKLIDAKQDLEANGEASVTQLQGNIAFKNVDFAYNSGEPVLRNLSFQVASGKTLAIVGPTGAGKSSVINLISGLYDIQGGVVEVDGVDIRKYDYNSLRSHVAVVLQDVFLFSGSIYDNVKLYDSSISDTEVVAACKSVGIHDFIMTLPDQYNYKVMERGGTLSAGQRQLISFARALAFDPAILILDEATASIDSESEELIQKAIEVLMKGRTSIVIAHRLSTIKHADEIMVLVKGEIAEKGTHQELLRLNGHYSRLYQSQFAEV